MESVATHPFWQNLFRQSQGKTDKIANFWQNTALFEGLSTKRCRSLIHEMHIRSYQPGETVFNKGEVGIGAALIFSGKVQIRAGDILLAELTQGDFFGEVALVLDEPRTADAIACEQTELVFFLRPGLNELIDKAPRDGVKVVNNLCHILATRLGKANEQLSHNKTSEVQDS